MEESSADAQQATELGSTEEEKAEATPIDEPTEASTETIGE
jgi:hypothetical protein